MKPKKKSVRLWAVVFWLLVWQGASMALAVLYPHGALLLASPLSALARLGELAVTAAFNHNIDFIIITGILQFHTLLQ